MNKYIVLIMALLCASYGQSQTKTVSGYVEDSESSERLIGANVQIVNEKSGITTNKYGFFGLVVSNQKLFKIKISYIGYETMELSLTTQKDTTIVIKLRSVTQNLENVVIRAQSGKENYDDPTMGRFVVPMEMVKKSPAILGESDIMKTIQMLPGVQAGTEGTVGMNVRGGTADQNLILLDGVPVYNINHLFGFFSVINPDAISHVEFFKGNIPARYGGRLSSVLDLSMKEGNRNEWKGSFGLSPIAGRLMIEGPIKKGISSVMISARSTWLGELATLATKIAKADLISYGFYDLNTKFNYQISDNDRLYFSFYTGKDKFQNTFDLGHSSTYKFQFDWGNKTASVRWNRLWNKRLFSNLTTYYTQFDYNISAQLTGGQTYKASSNSTIFDLATKIDFDYTLNQNHSLKFGSGVARHTFDPEIRQSTISDTTLKLSPQINTTELTAYIDDDFSVGSKLRFNAGLHYAVQVVNGTTYNSVQPRLSARYLVSDRSSVKISFNKMTQFLHLLSNSSLGLPTDLWVPVTSKIAPEYATQWSVGYSQSLPKNWNISLELYTKQMTNVIEYKDGVSFLNGSNTAWYDKVSIGNSQSVGMECYIEKSVGRTKGWLSYTLSKTMRTFEDINQNKPFPFKNDRRHSISLALLHEIRKNKSLSINFVFNSGTAVTLPTSNYQGIWPSDFPKSPDFDKYQLPFYTYFNSLGDISERNNYRTPAYHRMDISYRITKQKRYGSRSWIFSCYNTYNRRNPFFLFYDKQQLKQYSMFPAVPSITYQRDF